MADPHPEPGDDRFDRVLAEYMRQVEGGQGVDREQFIRQHAEWSRQLREYFDNEDAVGAGPGNSAAEDTKPFTGGGVGGPEADAVPGCVFPAADAPEDAALAPGEAIGRYHIERLLGEGKYGRVYLAGDRDLKRRVAIKVPRGKCFASARALDRFLDEARAAAQLDHPGIVAVYDVGTTVGGVHYIVTQYIDGPTLKQRLAEHQPTPGEAAELMVPMAEAVHYAHAKGFVHRDLKPANILLDAAGRPHVVDFGLALHESQQRRRPGESAGSPAYMAPEQVRGESHRLDGRSDIWALGVILYEMLARRRPFDGPTRDGLEDEILHREPKPPRQIDDAIPAELERICLKCLSKDIAGRYATAGDVATDLRRWRRPESRPLKKLGAILLASGCVLIAGWLYLGLADVGPTKPLRVDVAMGYPGMELSDKHDLALHTGESYMLRVGTSRTTRMALVQFAGNQDGTRYEPFDLLSQETHTGDNLRSEEVSPEKPFLERFRTTPPPGTEAIFVLTAPNEHELKEKYRKLKQGLDSLTFVRIGFPERVLQQIAQRGKSTRMPPDEAAEGIIQQLQRLDLAETDRLLFIWNLPYEEPDSDPMFPKDRPKTY